MQLMFESFQFPACFVFLRLGVGELGTKEVRGSGEFFLLTRRLCDSGSRNVEVFLQAYLLGFRAAQALRARRWLLVAGGACPVL